MTIYDFVRGLFNDAETFGPCEFMTEEEAAYNLEEYRKQDYEMPNGIEPWELMLYWNYEVSLSIAHREDA